MLKDYENLSDLKLGLNRYFDFYNDKRFHESLRLRQSERSLRIEILSEATGLEGLGLKTQDGGPPCSPYDPRPKFRA